MERLGRQLDRSLSLAYEVRGLGQYIGQHEEGHVQAASLMGLFHEGSHPAPQVLQLLAVQGCDLPHADQHLAGCKRLKS